MSDNEDKKDESSAFEIMNYALFLMEKNLKENLIAKDFAKEPDNDKFMKLVRFIDSGFSEQEKTYIFHNFTFITMFAFIKCLDDSKDLKDEKETEILH